MSVERQGLEQALERFARQLLVITEVLRDEARRFVRPEESRDLLAEAAQVRGCSYTDPKVAQVVSLAHGLDAIAAAILQQVDAVGSLEPERRDEWPPPSDS